MNNKTAISDKQAGTEVAGKDSTQKQFPEYDALDRFVSVFEASARRWELVMYPFMLVFGIFAVYGFFLIYSLSKDVGTIATGMDPELGKHLRNMSESVIYLSENMRTMTRRIYHMSDSMETMTSRMEAMDYMEPMLTNIHAIALSAESINQTIHTMRMISDGMRYEADEMSDSLGSMRLMNSFVPQ